MNSFTANKNSDPLFVDLLSNGGFKAVFGDVNNKDVVMSIINVLLPSHRRVVDIEYLPTDQEGPVLDLNKEFQYDFMCRDASGAVFIVEMQRYHEEYWFKRCVSYASRAYDRQNRRGGDYDVPPVYLIGLMGTEIKHRDMNQWQDRFVSEYTFREKESNELLDETIVIIFAELARFDKAAEECLTEQERMLYLLKNIGSMKIQPECFETQTYGRIFEACRLAGFSEEKRIKYDSDMNDERRLKGQYAAYRKIGYAEGNAEGRAEGREEGREEGRAEGLAEGLAEGRSKERSEIIVQLHSKGMGPEQISEMLDIAQEEIQSILAKK